MKFPALLLALALAACGGGDDRPRMAAEPLTPQQQACRDEAVRSNTRQAAANQYNYANPTNVDRVNADVAAAQMRAERDCLVRNGVMKRGGVEPLRR